MFFTDNRVPNGMFENAKEIPYISIVILTKNAGKPFRNTLDLIFKQQVDVNYEVIVVDSGSTDETLTIIENYDIELHKVDPSDFNFGLTRNLGFSLSKGEFIVTLSQDAVPCTEHWLNNIINPFSNSENVVAVQGSQKIPSDKDVFYWEKWHSFHFTLETKRWKEQYKVGLSFANCAIRRNYWESNQFVRIPFSEDKYFQKTIVQNGYEVVYAKDAACYHAHQYTSRSLRKRIISEGKGWKFIGVRYSLQDCFKDIYRNKWMIKEGIRKYLNKEIRRFFEAMFLFLRPIYLYIGNNMSR